MNEFLKWLNTSPIASACRVAVAVFAGSMIAEFYKVGDFDFSNWKTWLIGALVVAIPPVLRWLNPADKSFGNVGEG